MQNKVPFEQITSLIFRIQLIKHPMTYIRLSEQLQKLNNPQHSDSLVKQFRIAVREGQFEAVELPGSRIELSKNFKRRGQINQTYRKSVREMLFEATPEIEAWFTETAAQLSQRKGKTSVPRVSLENIESGAMDFKALAAATRQKMESSHMKGQTLGNRRKKNKGLHRK